MNTQNENKSPTILDKFFEGKSLFAKITLTISFTIVLFWVFLNLSAIINVSKKVISLFNPVIYGFFIAYFINIFMVILEKLWDKCFKKSKVKFKVKRGICVLLSIILVLGILFTVLFLIIPKLTSTVHDLINTLPAYLESTGEYLSKKLDAFNITIPEFTVDTKKLQNELGKILPQIGSDFVNTTVNVTSSIFSALLDFVLSAVFTLYMLIQKEKLCAYLKRLLYAVFNKKHADSVMFYLDVTNKTFTKFITGQLCEAVIIGILCFTGMLVFRIPYALIISVLIGFTALIPVFGAFIGTFIGAFLIVVVNPVKAFWFVIFIIILQQLEGNLIYPRVVGKSVGLPGILVLTAVTIGGSAMGITGMLFAVPIVSVIYFILNRFIEKRGV